MYQLFSFKFYCLVPLLGYYWSNYSVSVWVFREMVFMTSNSRITGLFHSVLGSDISILSFITSLSSRRSIIFRFQKYLGHDYKRKRGELETCSQEREPAHAKRSAGEWLSVRSTEEFLNHVWLQQLISNSFIQELELYKEEAKHNRMETQDNGFLLVIDGVRKEKERLTAAKLLVFYLAVLTSFSFL